MKNRWILLIGANFANSLFVAYIIVLMYIQTPHRVTLVEQNQFIIASETVLAVSIVVLTILMASLNFFRKRTRLRSL